MKKELPSTQPTLLTAEDLWKQNDDDYRYELVKGVLHRKPFVGFAHGVLRSKVASDLYKSVKKNKLGCVCSAGTGHKISQIQIPY